MPFFYLLLTASDLTSKDPPTASPWQSPRSVECWLPRCSGAYSPGPSPILPLWGVSSNLEHSGSHWTSISCSSSSLSGCCSWRSYACSFLKVWTRKEVNRRPRMRRRKRVNLPSIRHLLLMMRQSGERRIWKCQNMTLCDFLTQLWNNRRHTLFP